MRGWSGPNTSPEQSRNSRWLAIEPAAPEMATLIGGFHDEGTIVVSCTHQGRPRGVRAGGDLGARECSL